eukprot:34923-Amphidinium_carterae.1
MNRESLQIYSIRHVTVIHSNLARPTTFIIADVNAAILGLDTIANNNLEVGDTRLQWTGHLSNTKLHYVGHHFYINAMMVNSYDKTVDYTTKRANWYNEWYDEDATKPTALQQPYKPTPPE